MTQHITVEQLRSHMASDEHITLLDVREPDEYTEFALESSLHIPLGELPERISELEQYRDQKLIVYCRSGNRSGQACMFLELSGFTHVVNLAGGMLAWARL
jgi:rhodanese-related sulfurtransferase